MNKRSRIRNKERNKYAKLKNIVSSSSNGLDPLDIPNCSASLANDKINFIGLAEDKYLEQMAFYKRQRIERGFDDTELWNLEHTIAKYALPRLIEYRKVMIGYPVKAGTFEDYQAIVDKMIYAFDHIVNEDKYDEELEKQIGIDWIDYTEMVKLENGHYELKHGKRYDEDKMKKYYEAKDEINKKIDEGLSLFGEYFRALWW